MRAPEAHRLSDVVIAQEVDIDYTASVAGVIIPGKWLQACVDAHLKLGVEPTGRRRAAFDVADEGGDNCAVGRAGESWSKTWRNGAAPARTSSSHPARLSGSAIVTAWTN
jgi:hypothetical protein